MVTLVLLDSCLECSLLWAEATEQEKIQSFLICSLWGVLGVIAFILCALVKQYNLPENVAKRRVAAEKKRQANEAQIDAQFEAQLLQQEQRVQARQAALRRQQHQRLQARKEKPRIEAKKFYLAHKDLLRTTYPPQLIRAYLEVELSPDKSPEQLWVAFRALVEKLQPLVTEERERQQQEKKRRRQRAEQAQARQRVGHERIEELRAEIEQYDQHILETEQALREARASGHGTHVLERQLAGMRHQRQQSATELTGLLGGDHQVPF